MMMLAMMTMMMTGCVGWRMMVGRRGRGQLLAHFGAPARNPAPAAHTNASNTAHTHTHTIQAACTHFGTDAFNALFILLPTALMNYVHTQILNATSPCWIAVKNGFNHSPAKKLQSVFVHSPLFCIQQKFEHNFHVFYLMNQCTLGPSKVWMGVWRLFGVFRSARTSWNTFVRSPVRPSARSPAPKI